MKNNHFLATAAILLLIAMTVSCTKKSVPEGIQNYAQLKEHFVDPPSEYRSAPLWDWNDKISEEGIDFHMKKFKEGGIGGVFIHPRPGLLTEYVQSLPPNSRPWQKNLALSNQKISSLGLKFSDLKSGLEKVKSQL